MVGEGVLGTFAVHFELAGKDNLQSLGLMQRVGIEVDGGCPVYEDTTLFNDGRSFIGNFPKLSQLLLLNCTT